MRSGKIRVFLKLPKPWLCSPLSLVCIVQYSSIITKLFLKIILTIHTYSITSLSNMRCIKFRSLKGCGMLAESLPRWYMINIHYLTNFILRLRHTNCILTEKNQILRIIMLSVCNIDITLVKSMNWTAVWDEITYLFLNFNGCTVEVWEWISSNFIYHFTGHVITHPCWVLK